VQINLQNWKYAANEIVEYKTNQRRGFKEFSSVSSLNLGVPDTKVQLPLALQKFTNRAHGNFFHILEVHYICK
jgi:hypothetical protein